MRGGIGLAGGRPRPLFLGLGMGVSHFPLSRLAARKQSVKIAGNGSVLAFPIQWIGGYGEGRRDSRSPPIRIRLRKTWCRQGRLRPKYF